MGKKLKTAKRIEEATSVIKDMANMSSMEDEAKIRLAKRVLLILNTSSFETAVGDLVLVSMTRMLVNAGMPVTDPVIARMYQDAARFKQYQADVHEVVKGLVKK
jgi:hypothetical protein